MNNDQNRALVAAGLAAVVLIGWQMLFAPKYNQSVQEKVVADNTRPAVTTPVTKTENTTVTSDATKPAEVKTVNVSSVELVNGDYKFVLNSDFSVKEAVGYSSKFALRDFSGVDNFFRVQLVNSANQIENLQLSFEEIANSKTINGYDEAKGIKVNFSLEDNGKLLYTITSTNPYKLYFTMTSTEKTSSNKTSRQFVSYGSDIEMYIVNDDERGEDSLKWFGLDFSHHVFANVFPVKNTMKFVSNERGVMTFETVAAATSFGGYLLYSLKNYDYLSSFKDQLDLSIDFGIFGILSVPILKGMQFLYTYLENYGLAILVLTFLIRFLTYPLQYKSFKSMKKMQKVQPELAKLKEKFKDDPQRMQKETMELFKRAGANPLGGCLPMLLQVPIFIAFYQAINNSVELVGSPFYGWIIDLSSKDPYYVLPVLMAVTMLAQTKLNPSTTADPNQQKVMYIMPIVFGFIMKDLPAGLNLYFFFSNLLGIAQQLYVYKTVD